MTCDNFAKETPIASLKEDEWVLTWTCCGASGVFGDVKRADEVDMREMHDACALIDGSIPAPPRNEKGMMQGVYPYQGPGTVELHNDGRDDG